MAFISDPQGIFGERTGLGSGISFKADDIYTPPEVLSTETAYYTWKHNLTLVLLSWSFNKWLNLLFQLFQFI